MKASPFVFTAALGAVLLSGLLLRFAGLKEPFGLHPDERPISQWMDRMHEHHTLLPKCYAGGFFVLADAARRLFEWTLYAPLHRWQYFTRATDQFNPAPPDTFAFGRPFNAVLGTLVIWLAALFARRVSGSRAAALADAALMAVAAARGRAGWGAALKPAIAIAVVVTAITFFITPGMTQSSFANMGYWVDWGNLLLYAAAFGAVGGALAWPVAAMMRRA